MAVETRVCHDPILARYVLQIRSQQMNSGCPGRRSPRHVPSESFAES